MAMVSVYKLVLASLRMQLFIKLGMTNYQANKNLYVNCISEGYISLAKSKKKMQGVIRSTCNSKCNTCPYITNEKLNQHSGILCKYIFVSKLGIFYMILFPFYSFITK